MVAYVSEARMSSHARNQAALLVFFFRPTGTRIISPDILATGGKRDHPLRHMIQYLEGFHRLLSYLPLLARQRNRGVNGKYRLRATVPTFRIGSENQYLLSLLEFV